MSRARGGGRAEGRGSPVMMEQLGALLLASRAQGEEREGQTDRDKTQAQVRHLYT